MSDGGEEPRFAGLRQVSTDDLSQIAEGLRTGTLRAPVTPGILEHAGLGYLKEPFAPFQLLDRTAAVLVVDAVLAERKHVSKSRLDLVWSGTDAGPSQARYTQIVIPELVAGARRTVTIAGYSFDKGAGIFPALRDAMRDRNVRVRFFLDIHQLHERLSQQLRNARRTSRLLPVRLAKVLGAESYARAVIALFLELHWPFEGPRPDLFYDPRTAESGTFASLHAKCVIADHERALITSANFTDRGQTRNIEVGVLIHDAGYAVAVEQQWDALVASGGVLRG